MRSKVSSAQSTTDAAPVKQKLSTVRCCTIVLGAVLILAIGVGCSSPVSVNTTVPSAIVAATPEPTLTSMPSPTPTLTVTLTPPPSPTTSPTDTPTPASTPTPTPMVGDPNRRAMWVWNTQDLCDVEGLQTVLAFCHQRGISVLYLYSQDLLTSNESCLQTILVNAASVEIELLGGDPTWATAEGYPDALSFVDRAVSFAEASTVGSSPSAIHLDVEPHLLDRWGPDQESIITQYLNMLYGAKKQLSEAKVSLKLVVDIPFWFDEIQVTYSGETRSLNELVQSIADQVVLMDYRDHATGEDGIIVHANDELRFAERIGKLVTIGVETNNVDPEKVTFYQEGEATMEEELKGARPILADSPAFHGFAVHDYVGYRQIVSTATPIPTLTHTVTPARTTTTPTQKITPSQTPTPRPHVSLGSHPPHMVMNSVTYSINNGPAQHSSNEGVIELKSGDYLVLLDCSFQSPEPGGEKVSVQAEAYIRKGDDFDWDHGRFSEPASIRAGEQSCGPFGDGWHIEPGSNRIVIVLMHYWPGGHELDDRFFLNLALR